MADLPARDRTTDLGDLTCQTAWEDHGGSCHTRGHAAGGSRPNEGSQVIRDLRDEARGPVVLSMLCLVFGLMLLSNYYFRAFSLPLVPGIFGITGCKVLLVVLLRVRGLAPQEAAVMGA